jgi:predicted MFS family arabinose efflux permease
MTLRLRELEFTPLEMAWACATQALGSVAGPVMAGQIADRWWPAERLLAVFAVLAGALLWLLASLTTPMEVFAAGLAIWLLIAPILTLGASISFAHLPVPARDYGGIRLWGTVGWVAIGWIVGYWRTDPAWLEPWLWVARPELPRSEVADTFRLGGLASFALALYALTLPATPPRRLQGSVWATLTALRLLRQRPIAVYWGCVLGVCITIPFYSQVTPLLLQDLGVSPAWLGPTLTLSQSMEVVSLAILPMLLLRLGVRGTMRLGLVAWAVMLIVLTFGEPLGLVISALTLNGLCICGFFVAGQVFVQGRAPADVRASAQALVTFMNGLGTLAGTFLVGWVRELANEAYRPTFFVGAAIATTLVGIFLVGFPSDER